MRRFTLVERIALVALALTCALSLADAGPAIAVATPAGATQPAAKPTHWPARPAQPTARSAAVTRTMWLKGVHITEYWPVPERWFAGKRVRPPGLTTSHRLDWLYSARGVTMQGTGIGLDGRFYHVNALGLGGWVDRLGRRAPIGGGREVFWRAGGFWRSPTGTLTYPLEAGGWANGPGRAYVPLRGVSFLSGHGRPGLRYYGSLAVDPRLIPMGSRVYVPAYRGRGNGWFVAQDTGGAIRGLHIDVYRSPPGNPSESAQSLRGQQILVVPPGQRAPASLAPPAGAPQPGGAGKRPAPPKGGGGKSPPPTGGSTPG